MLSEQQHTVKTQNSIPISEHVPLADKNWFQTGGSARYFCEPKNSYEFQEALSWAEKNAVPVVVIGQGANMLISDAGIDGLVIRLAVSTIEILSETADSCLVRAGAGVTIDALIEFCLAHNISGLEEFSGIPGSVGGAIYINLHYFQFLLGNFLTEAHVIEKSTGTISRVTTEWFNFGYDHSTLCDGNYFLLNATFQLKKISELETAFARGRRTEIIRHRRQRYPYSHTCGSFFRNFHPHEVTIESNGKKMIYVAYYLDKIGIKGELSVGDAIVSHQHANMLVNKGNATSQDIITLARTMQEMVFNNFGIIPQPECLLLGFSNYPLL